MSTATEDGPEFVTGPHISGHNGSLRPYVHRIGPPGVRPPPAIAEKLAALRQRCASSGARRPR